MADFVIRCAFRVLRLCKLALLFDSSFAFLTMIKPCSILPGLLADKIE